MADPRGIYRTGSSPLVPQADRRRQLVALGAISGLVIVAFGLWFVAILTSSDRDQLEIAEGPSPAEERPVGEGEREEGDDDPDDRVTGGEEDVEEPELEAPEVTPEERSDPEPDTDPEPATDAETASRSEDEPETSSDNDNASQDATDPELDTDEPDPSSEDDTTEETDASSEDDSSEPDTDPEPDPSSEDDTTGEADPSSDADSGSDDDSSERDTGDDSDTDDDSAEDTDAEDTHAEDPDTDDDSAEDPDDEDPDAEDPDDADVVSVTIDEICTVEVDAEVGDASSLHAWDYADCAYAPVPLDDGGERWIVVRASMPSGDVDAAGAQERAGDLGVDGGVLWSSHYPSLNPGYWVAYDGPFPDAETARNAAEAADGDAYARALADEGSAG